MNPNTRPLFRQLAVWLSRLHPLFAGLSLLAFLLGFTPLSHAGPMLPVLHRTLLPASGLFFDVFFALFFLVRLTPWRQDTGRRQRLLDFLSALPALLPIVEAPLLAAAPSLPLVRILGFFRLFRVLSLFPLFHRFHRNSPWAQERVGKTVMVILLIGIPCVAWVETLQQRHQVQVTVEKVEMYEKLTGRFSLAVQILPQKSMIAWQQGEDFYRPLEEVLSPSEYTRLALHPDLLVIRLDSARSVIVHDRIYLRARDAVLFFLALALLATALAVLVRMSLMYAADLARIERLTSLIEANTHTTTRIDIPEPMPLFSPARSPAMDELQALASLVDRLVLENKFRAEHGETPPENPAEPVRPPTRLPAGGAPPDRADEIISRFAGQLREALLQDLKEQSRSTSLEAVRQSAKSLVDYLKKEGYGA